MNGFNNCIYIYCVCFLFALPQAGCSQPQKQMLDQMPDYVPGNEIENHAWHHEEPVKILGYSGNVMEIGISPDGEYLLFNDRKRPNKDMHWSSRIDNRTYRYGGKVENTVSGTVDGTPSFDGYGNIYYTTLRRFPQTGMSIYKARFRQGIAVNPVPVEGSIYVANRNAPPTFWISLDPDITDDGQLMFYSEGRFNPHVGFPYPFNVRGAKWNGEKFERMDDRILRNINTGHMEYAPAISSDGLELFFTRIGKVNGRPKMVGIFTVTRDAVDEPFGMPERIMAITGDVEAPVLSGDENLLYYHRRIGGVYKAYRVTRVR